MKTSLGRFWKMETHFKFSGPQKHTRGGHHNYDWFI